MGCYKIWLYGIHKGGADYTPLQLIVMSKTMPEKPILKKYFCYVNKVKEKDLKTFSCSVTKLKAEYDKVLKNAWILEE